MSLIKRNLKVSCSIAALVVASMTSAHAAQQAAAADDLEELVVTGSRISIQGYQAPTPTTVVGSEQLERDARVNVADALMELPSVGISQTPSNGNGAGRFSQGDVSLSIINLRGLGTQRNLVLFDGQRIVASNLFGGGVDLNTIPSDLIERIDVVTAGASAAYGSDAVSGVINLVLNKRFTGFKGNFQVSNGTAVNHKQGKADLTYGTDFAGDKAHFIISGDYVYSPTPVFNQDIRGYNSDAIVLNPAATSTNGLPLFIHVKNTGNAQNTQGGLITANTAAAAGSGGTLAANGLRGLQFVGPNGDPVPFNFGNINGANAGVCWNCSNDATTAPGSVAIFAQPYSTVNVFSYGSYQATDDIKASIQINYGYSASRNTGGTRTSANVIPADNAYLPLSIARQFGTLSNGFNAATGVGGTFTRPAQTISVGTTNTNNIDLRNPSIDLVCSTLAIPCQWVNRTLWRGVGTLEGQIGDNWSWNLYGQHSWMIETQTSPQNSFGPRYNMAIDSVVVTSANQNNSGLPLGSIQCRALLDPATRAAAAGCVPLDIFGNGVASPAAIRYVNPGWDKNSGIINYEKVKVGQTVFAATVQGTLPFGLPAGNIATAFGAEARWETGGIPSADPNGVNATWSAGNFTKYSGKYDVQEGFIELGAPLLKDQFVRSASLSVATRLTNYSTSGLVQTWKVGLTSEIDQNIKVRGSISRDIRAPLISDLFSPGILAIAQLRYPSNTASYPSTNAQGGNINLTPEKATTESLGVVLTPAQWGLEGLSASIDYYHINIKDAFYTPDAQTVIDRCLQGEQLYCPLLHFSAAQNGGLKPYQVDTFPVNAAELRTSGFDLAITYAMDVLSGKLTWGLTGNYTQHIVISRAGITYDYAGAIGGPLAYQTSGVPKLRGNLSATYTQGPASVTLSTRYFGSAVLTAGVQDLPANITRASLSSTGAFTAGVGDGSQMDDNTVKAAAYMDVRASYMVSDNITMYAAADNVLDKMRPRDGNQSLYDALGTVVRMGVRLKY